MKAKTPTQRIYDLRVKLETLATRGVNGEAEAAKVKLARLLKRYDFSKPYVRVEDIFAGQFHRASVAERIAAIDDAEIATFAKWAIENRCQIPCVFRGNELFANATRNTAKKLAAITSAVLESFTRLWAQYAKTPGANQSDRRVFLRGIYDGMLNDLCTGELLPSRAQTKAVRTKKKSLAFPVGLAEHPYTIAARLGRQVALCVPLPDIEHQLEQTISGELSDEKKPLTP